MTPSAQRLSEYLAHYGILTCNRNPYLPALDDIGCGWTDVTALIDAHALFYCKVFRKRTVYLSPQAYYLLKQCRGPHAMNASSRAIFDILKSGPALNTESIKWLAGLPLKEYTNGFNALLENMHITAIGNGQVLNPSWSTFLYGTASAWESLAGTFPVSDNPVAELWDIFSHTMSEKDFLAVLK